MLNAANENVLAAVDACKFDRVIATVGNVTLLTKPRLEREEVELLLDHLIRESYVERRFILTAAYYTLTARGDQYMQNLAARCAAAAKHAGDARGGGNAA